MTFDQEAETQHVIEQSKAHEIQESERKKALNREEIVEEEEAPEEGKEKSWSGYIIRQEIYPVNCILLDAKHDDQLMQRIKDNMSEQEAFGTHYNGPDMKRRL